MHTDDHHAAGPIGTLEFDASTARLRADADTFFALVDHVGGSGDASGEAPFTASGVAVGGRAHPSVRAGLGAVEEPCARLQVEVSTPLGTQLHEGWLDRVSALLLDRGDGTYDFVEVDAEFLAVTLVRVTDLQSRPRLEGGGGRVRADVLDALLSPDVVTRRQAAETLAGAASEWPAVAASLRSGRWQVCGLDVAHTLGPSTEARRVAWLDTPTGLLRIDADAEGPFITGTSAGQLWRSIVAALPTDVGLDLLPRTA